MAQTPQTDAQRANLTDAQWAALTPAQKDEARSKFTSSAAATVVRQGSLGVSPYVGAVSLSDAQRAGLTDTQWAALSEAQRNQYRTTYPDLSPPVMQVSVPSPPDPHNLTALAITDHTHHIATAAVVAEKTAEKAKDEVFDGLPNTPGGRNSPSLSYFDPSREETA